MHQNNLEFLIETLLKNYSEELERISDLLLSIDPNSYGDSIHSIITDLVTSCSNDIYEVYDRLHKYLKEKNNV